jgi:micrococcal nuclease
VAVPLLFLLPPLGLFLMWRYQSWDRLGKVCLTLLTATFLLCGGVLYLTDAAPPVTYIALPTAAPSPTAPVAAAVTPELAPGETPPAAVIAPAVAPPEETPPAAVTVPAVAPPGETLPAAVTAPAVAPPGEAEGLSFISMKTPVSRGEKASVTVHGTPGATYEIAVYYKSKSEAAGLEPRVAGGDGVVTWSWRVGSATKPGAYALEVIGGGETLRVPFEVE